MPSSQTKPLQLDAKIRELEIQREMHDGNISSANKAHLDMLRYWRKYAGRDIVLVVQPHGAISGDVGDAHFVELHDAAAADMMAFATRRNQRVREATESEAEAYRKAERLKGERARREAILAQAEKARAAMQQMISDAAAVEVTISSQAEAEAAPLAVYFDSPTVAAPAVDVAVKKPADRGASLVVAVDELAEYHKMSLLDFTTEAVATKLAAAGFGVEELAAATPADVAAKVRGIGDKKAADLVIRAGEWLKAEADAQAEAQKTIDEAAAREARSTS